MKAIVLASVLALISSQAFAQTPASPSAPPAQGALAAALAARDELATPIGHELNISLGHYNYIEHIEARGISISIHGAKFAGEYTGTMAVSKRRNVFAQANVRGITGNTTYDGWCSPFLITPDSGSPNGYALGFGDQSPCSENGDSDWYLEGRALVGRDLIGQTWAWSPYAGVGFRHLSNGTSGIPGFRTDEYLYVPLGITARRRMASHRVLSVNLEVDPLIRGWQKTRDSKFGSGDIPATPTAPAFTINGFTDVSFPQDGGWAVRASATLQVTRRLSVEPYFVRWNVNSSPVRNEIATYTVLGVAAQEQIGFYEPKNLTNEFGVKLGFCFGGTRR